VTTLDKAAAREVLPEPAPVTQPLGLEHLIRPTPLEVFLDQHWGRAAGHYPNSIAGRMADILDLASFEQLLAALPRANEGWLHLARDTARPVPATMLDTDGMLRLPELRAAFGNGETLYLTKAHRLSGPLMRLSRAVEIDLAAAGTRLRAPVSAHVFLTPPASRGFLPHRDAHHSLILQLHGSKQWDVYHDRDAIDVHRRHGPVGTDPPPGDRLCFTLTAGDVLYVPQWWVHAGRAENQGSLHVTLRMFPLRWVDVLSAVAPSLSALERPLRRGEGEDPDRVTQSLLNLLRQPDARADLTSATRAFLERTSVPDTALAGDGLGGVLAADTVAASSWLVRSAGVSCVVTCRDGMATLGFPGGSLSAPAALEPVLRQVAAVARLRPLDLASADGDYDRVELARQLVRAGILSVERGSPVQHATPAPT
jgi:hypothetical protein